MVASPKGNNQLGAASSFEERMYYDFVSFASSYFHKSQIDLRTLSLFGKVDEKGNQIILPTKRTLKDSGMITSVDNSGDHFMLTVFAKPFMELRERFVYLFKRGSSSENSSFTSLDPVKGLLFWEEEYSNHISEISSAFYDFALALPQKETVKDFETFIKAFDKFSKEACPYTTFTLKNYMMSRFCDPLTSGMMIELASGDASDDVAKYNDFIKDPNYPLFVEEAAKFGFIVDKHVPWRLVVNLNSPNMKKSLSDHGYPSLNQVFSKAYVDPTSIGFEMYLRMLQRLYTGLITKSPQYTIANHGDFGTSTSIKFREKINFRNPKQIMDKMGDVLALKLYISLRIREKNLGFSQVKFDSLVKKALDFKKQVDLKSAVVYIDSKTKEGSPSKQKPEFRI